MSERQASGGRILFSSEQIHHRVCELGRQISTDYQGQPLVLIGVLKGSLYFLADLSRQINLPLQLDFIGIGTYAQSTHQKGIVRITKDLDLDITGRHVLLVEDILRTGLTISYLVRNIESRQPASVKVCTLLHNPEQQLINVPVAYYGFMIDRQRVVGYGMDVQEEDRHLPYIAEISRSN
ncbi:MAG: hypoxanthine phosphoribosyltransferase [Clostridia bacterium]|nr:hypoxanthine phosphoribosyltransferase [Eubacteriales bacterium]MDD3866197.1 hypoxanthine phosphoribosyltransferase [Eubacteriales bacterium]MDD4461263.1 hypoxanthine phosphoribosyltransferase [Eubacteriales bacterium]NCC48356.1 hypoxanthine phosphoribosyltransferase [Clostridia bacterium]